MESYTTAAQGVADATNDFNEDWIVRAIALDPAAMESQLEIMVGGTKEYRAAYAAAAQRLMAPQPQKGE